MGPATTSALTSAWRVWGARAALLAALAFAASTALSALDALNITTPEVHVADGIPLPDRVFAILQNESARFPWVFTATVIAIVSFAALAALGPVLRRGYGGDDPEGSLVSGAFAFGGLIGIAGQLAFLGGQVVATETTYCDCNFKDPQLIARGGVLDLVSSMQTWMIVGVMIAFGIGLIAVATLAARRQAPGGWVLLSRWLGVVLVILAVIRAGLPPLVSSLGWQIDADLITGVGALVVLLVLVPWWALWLRRLLLNGAATA
jgi:hypothetical protein